VAALPQPQTRVLCVLGLLVLCIADAGPSMSSFSVFPYCLNSTGFLSLSSDVSSTSASGSSLLLLRFHALLYILSTLISAVFFYFSVLPFLWCVWVTRLSSYCQSMFVRCCLLITLRAPLLQPSRLIAHCTMSTGPQVGCCSQFFFFAGAACIALLLLSVRFWDSCSCSMIPDSLELAL
jgi:hypothetical protein